MTDTSLLPAIIFDFDGTLADTAGRFIEISNILAKKYHFKALAQEDIGLLRNSTVTNIVKNYCKVPWYKLPFILLDFKLILADTADQAKLFPEIVQILFELKNRGYRIGLLTSSPSEVVDVVINQAGLGDFFDFKKTSASIFHKNKDIKKMIQRSDLNPDNLYYVGDEVRDILACQRIPVKCLSVTWGFSSHKLLKEYNPDRIIETPNQLLEYFK